MDPRVRALVRDRFRARCGYCGVHEDLVGATLTVDHHQPHSCGGTDEEGNLVYACARCNEHKGASSHERDPPHTGLLHPGRDDLTSHLTEREDGHVVGLTPAGRFLIDRLRLNRAPLVARRLRVRAAERAASELGAARAQVRELEDRILGLRSEIESTAAEIERATSGERR